MKHTIYKYAKDEEDFIPHDRVPDRMTRGMAEGIKDIIQDKVVCDLCGCSYGDNLMFLSKYAKDVCGIDVNPERVEYSKNLGLNVKKRSCWDAMQKKDLPKADVYFCWMHPDHIHRFVREFFKAAHANAILIQVGFFPPEIPVVKDLAKIGELRRIDFEELNAKSHHPQIMQDGILQDPGIYTCWQKGTCYIAVISAKDYEKHIS